MFCLLLVTGVEQLQPAPGAAVQRSSGRCEGHRLVSSPARSPGLRRGNGGPLPSLLEHSDRTGVTEYRHRLTGLQPGLVQTRQRAGKTSTCTHSQIKCFSCSDFHHWCPPGQHTRLLPEPDPGVEIPITHAGGQAHRTFVPSALLGKSFSYILFPKNTAVYTYHDLNFVMMSMFIVSESQGMPTVLIS